MTEKRNRLFKPDRLIWLLLLLLLLERLLLFIQLGPDYLSYSEDSLDPDGSFDRICGL